MGKHALLSASSSHRWLACPPSARLCESYEDKGSEYAQQGTDAHSLCEYKLQKALGIKADDPTENLTYYDSEMEVCAESYADYVMEQLSDSADLSYRPMMGEYVIYSQGKVVGGIYDDRFLLKKNDEKNI